MKPCYHCRYFDFDAGSPGYSEMTPGDDASARCGKRMWHYQHVDGFERVVGRKTFPLTIREALDTGLTCPHFEEQP